MTMQTEWNNRPYGPVSRQIAEQAIKGGIIEI